MSSDISTAPVAFILGAGFNIDAASEAGYSAALPSGLPGRYPLVDDLLKICFQRDTLPLNKSIEDLFQDSIDKGDKMPLERMCRYFMELDYFIIWENIAQNLKPREKCYNNAYIRFLCNFPKSPLITFNYDSLPEILLLSENYWSPKDGYGVAVDVNQRKIRNGPLPIKKSLRPILHLHGSLCIYPATFYYERQPGQDYPIERDYDKAQIIFDPDQLDNCFWPFGRIPPVLGYSQVTERVIAPIPDKAEGLKGEFIREMYKKAIEYLISATQVVVIGYSFNQTDRASYSKLLSAIIDKPVLLITGQNTDILKKRLSHEYPNVRWEAKNMTFKEWVNNGYPGVGK